VAQALPILLSPALTRLYSPEEFGQFAFWVAVITVVAPLATLRFDQAIITAETNQIADLIRICIACSVAWSVIGAVSVVLLVDNPATPLFTSPIAYLVLLPIGILLTAQFNTLYAVNTRDE